MQDESYDTAAGTSKCQTTVESDLLCTCCCELMVFPTTLNCGHTTCRHCLAEWVKASSKTICPLCRQPFVGIPKINVTIRKTIENFFPSQYAARHQEVERDTNIKDTLADFESMLARQLKRNEDSIVTGGCCFGAFLVISLGVCFWFGSSLMDARDVEYLYHKPLTKWSAVDVGRYVASLGTWAEPYEHAFVNAKLTGTAVAALEDRYLQQQLQIEDELHRKMLLLSFSELSSRGMTVKVPGSLWEYKSLYPGRALFLLYGAIHCPRATLLYLYWFDYEGILVPIVRSCCAEGEGAAAENVTVPHDFALAEELAAEHWIAFLVKALFLPFVIFAEFAWDWMDVHYWVSRAAILTCFLLTLSEAAALRRQLTEFVTLRSTRVVLQSVISCVKASLLWMLIFLGMAVIWGFTPKFLGDALFYCELCYAPLWQIRTLYRGNIL